MLSVEKFEGRKLIVLWAPGGQNRPYKAPAAVTANHRSLHYYIRRYSSTVEAKGETEQELLSLAAKVPFDDRFHLGARVIDLSKPLMQNFLQEIGSALAEDADNLTIENERRGWPSRIAVAQECGPDALQQHARTILSRYAD